MTNSNCMICSGQARRRSLCIKNPLIQTWAGFATDSSNYTWLHLRFETWCSARETRPPPPECREEGREGMKLGIIDLKPPRKMSWKIYFFRTMSKWTGGQWCVVRSQVRTSYLMSEAQNLLPRVTTWRGMTEHQCGRPVGSLDHIECRPS